jgi:superfamily II DNA helicase RecQ
MSLKIGDKVDVTGGKYKDTLGCIVERLTPQKVKLDRLENLINQSSVTKMKPLGLDEKTTDINIKPLASLQAMPKLNHENTIEQINVTANQRFKIQSVRPKQIEAIVAVLNGDDVLAVLPTGAGKSLIYQLPALMDERRGITVIISPLLALIQDQMSSLQQLGLHAARYDGSLGSTQKARVEQQILEFGSLAGSSASGAHDGPSIDGAGNASSEHPMFLFTTPETLLGVEKGRLCGLLTGSGRLVRWVLDEVSVGTRRAE